MLPPSVTSRVIVVSAKILIIASGSPCSRASSCCSATTFCCRVRIISRPVRSPTWASRGYWWPPKLRWLILPSAVRSNSAPQASSSQTRSGASWACSSAIRQLFRNLPPRIVSRKCTCQLSLGFTLPMAAAAPPSAMTVCALPNSDLEMTAVLLPASRASMAARSPEPRIGDGAGGHQPDVEVGEQHPAQRDPGVLHVLGVQLGHLGPHPVPHRVLGEMLEPPADRVPAGVAGHRVAPQQGRVDDQHQRPQAHVPPLPGVI